jgi:hypothetical protein
VSIGVITGRQFECSFYTSGSGETLWPSFYYCKLFSVDFPKSYESQVRSFTGSTSEKSRATVVYFAGSSQIDFIPKQIPKEFPNLNGLIFDRCNLTVLKNDLFSAEFVVLEFLNLMSNQIMFIEPFAFKNLKNLKWLRLWGNKIQSLPFNLFQNNPKLIYLDFKVNEINSISPNLLKNLNQLKYVDFLSNRCVRREFGCETCSVSQSELYSGLSTCFENCLKDTDCATKSELVEGTTTDSPAQNNATANNPNQTLQSLQTNLTQEIAEISEKLKSTEEKLEAKMATLNQALQVQQENLASLNQSLGSEVTKAVSSVEKMEMKVEMLSLKFSEAKALLDLDRKDRELTQAKCANQIESLSLKYANEKLAMELKVGKLEQEINDLKKVSQDRENTLKQEFDETINEMISQRLVQFKNELMDRVSKNTEIGIIGR